MKLEFPKLTHMKNLEVQNAEKKELIQQIKYDFLLAKINLE